jgi:hypothetical protein
LLLSLLFITIAIAATPCGAAAVAAAAAAAAATAAAAASTAAITTTTIATAVVATAAVATVVAAVAVVLTVMDGGLLPDLCVCAAVHVRRSPHAHKEPKAYWGLPERSFQDELTFITFN